MDSRTILKWLIIIFAIWLFIVNPAQVNAFLHEIGTFLSTLVQDIGNLFNSKR
jgi:hypothetical protein